MRRIKWITLHCTAGPQWQKPEDIQAYWRNKLGWKVPGYHHLISADGTDHHLLSIEQVSNGVAGFNANAIHISYIGGVQSLESDPVNAYGVAIDNRTDAQKKTQLRLVQKYNLMFPEAVIQGHRDFSPDKNRNGIIEPSEWIKACPSFSVKQWLKDVGFISATPISYTATTTRINLRSGPGLLHPVCLVLSKGEVVKQISTANGWAYVQTSSKLLGWAKEEYLK